MALECVKPRRMGALYVFAVLNLLSLVYLAKGDVIVNRGNESLIFYLDKEATFGPVLSEKGLTGFVVPLSPKVNTTCTEFGPPQNDTSKVWIAIIKRNGCKFDEMVLQAQNLGYNGAIVQNHFKDEGLVSMGGDTHADQVNIPSVFVGWMSGQEIRTNYCYSCTYYHNYSITINHSNEPGDFRPYLYWPFAIVVGTCFILMLSFMIFKWCRDINKRKKSRLSTKVLKKIPTKKFKKGDDYDVCAICLDDYEENDKLRILPCSHAYHCVCIDPWLTKNKKTCPVCKRKVIPGSNPDSDSNSDDDDNGNQSSSERAPLLGNNNNTRPARRSTFDNSEAVQPLVRNVNEVNPDSSDSESDSSDEEQRPRPTTQAPENVVNRSIVNRGYFKSSDEEEEDSEEEESDEEKEEETEENRQGIIANVSIVNGDQPSDSRNFNHIV